MQLLFDATLVLVRHSGNEKCNDRKIIPSIKINLSPIAHASNRIALLSRVMKLNAGREKRYSVKVVTLFNGNCQFGIERL